MTEENQRKTLKDCFLEWGAKGKQFITSPEVGKKIYTVLGYDEESGKLSVKYGNNRKSTIDLKSHANDLEVVTQLKEGEFYRVAFKNEDHVVFYNNNKNLIDADGKELGQTKVRGLIHIENPTDYISSLRQNSQKLERCAHFMESQLERKLSEIDQLVTDGEYKLDKDPQLNALPSLEEIEEDVNLDSFGSGSGLLDLSLQADNTSLGGILDEIYDAEKPYEYQETTTLSKSQPTIQESAIENSPKKRRGLFRRIWDWYRTGV